MMKAEYVAYAAGFLEADGCIHLPSSVRIANKNTDVLDWFVENFGGNVRSKGSPANCYEWAIHSEDAKAFLELVKPYLIFKGPQVDVWMEYRGTIMPRGSNIPQEVEDHRAYLRMRMKRLRKYEG